MYYLNRFKQRNSGFEIFENSFWRVNCSGLQACLENKSYREVLGSTPMLSSGVFLIPFIHCNKENGMTQGERSSPGALVQ